MQPATELPWRVEIDTRRQVVLDHDRAVVCANDNSIIAYIPPTKQDAAYIVHACNLHPQLVEALTEAADYMGEQNHPEETLTKARRVLAQCGIVGTPLERAMLPQCEEE